MSEKSLPAHALATLLEQTGRVLHGLGYAADLFPAQWSALRYFGRAEPQHRTASALARYQGLATGPVTRTVRTLIGKGLLVKAGSLGRGRSERIDLTPAGAALLATDPLSTVTAALEELSDSDRRGLAASLEVVLRHLQARHLESHVDA
jgi:DNA-binding MarR family transcriptional regulator